MTDNELKAVMKMLQAGAVTRFVRALIDAFDSGFMHRNNPTMAEMHRMAQIHCRDYYDVDTPNIVDEWGRHTAELCGLGMKPIQKDDWISADEKMPEPVEGNKVLGHNEHYAFECEYQDGVWANIGGEDMLWWVPIEPPPLVQKNKMVHTRHSPKLLIRSKS